MTTEREIIWHKTGRILGAYKFSYDTAGVATLEELHAEGWSPLELGNQAAGGGTGGGATALSELSDVQVSNPPTEGHVLTWDSGSGKWVNATPSGGTGGVDVEGVQDTVGAMFAGGTHENVVVTYDDDLGTLSLTVAGGGTGGLTQEQIEDLVALMVGGTHSGIAFAYDDASGTLTATVSGFQPLDGTLTALGSLDTTPGIVEQTGADAFAKRPFGVGGATSVPTRADADARYAALSHGHPQSEVVGLTAALGNKLETSTRGTVNGVAPLDAGGKVPSSFLEVVPTSGEPIFPAGGTIPSLTVAEQALVDSGDVVVQANGQRYMYTGTGSKTATASYVLLSDLSPDWSEITSVPATFPPTAHSHPQSEVTGLTAALALKAPLASPALTGLPTAPTPTVGDSSTLLATTAFVSASVGTGGAGVPNTQERSGPVTTGITTGEQVIGTATAVITGRHAGSVVRVWGSVSLQKGTGTTPVVTWTVRLRRGTTTSGTLLATTTVTTQAANEAAMPSLEAFDPLGAASGQYVITVQSSTGTGAGSARYYQVTALEVGGAAGPQGPPGVSGSSSLDGLSDVAVTSPAADQILKFTGSQWENAAAPAGGGATPTDSGIWAGTSSRTLADKLGEIVSVKDYGAVADWNGTTGTNNATAFAAAYAALPATGGVLRIPAGRYMCDYTGADVISNVKVTIQVTKPDVFVIGDGPGVSIIHMKGVTGTTLNAGSDDPSLAGNDVATFINFNAVNGGGVSGLGFTGEHVPGTHAAIVVGKARAKGIGVMNSQRIKIDDCNGINIAGNVVNLRGNTGTEATSTIFCIVSRVLAEKCAESGINFMGGCYKCQLIGCTSNDNQYHGFENGCQRASIIGNSFSTNTRYGITSVGQDSVIDGNVCQGNVLGEVHLQYNNATYNGNGTVISNNILMSVGAALAVAVDGSQDNFSIIGNRITGVDYCVYITGPCNGFKIDNNKMIETGAPGLYHVVILPSCSDFTINGNIFDGGSTPIYLEYYQGGAVDYASAEVDDAYSQIFSVSNNLFRAYVQYAWMLQGVGGTLIGNVLHPVSGAAGLARVYRAARCLISGTVAQNLAKTFSIDALADASVIIKDTVWGAVEDGYSGRQVVASGTAFSPDGHRGTTFRYTVTGAATIAAPANLTPGQVYTFVIAQNATGGFTVSWNAAYSFHTAWSNTSNTSNKVSVVQMVATAAATARTAAPQQAYI